MSEKVENIELDAEAVKAIAGEVAKGLGETIKSEVAEAVKAIEPTIKKGVGEGGTPGEHEEEDTDTEEAKAIKAESKERRLVKAAMALARGDKETLKAYNEVAMEGRTKAGYNNTDVNADGGYIVADPEFEAEIEKLAADYGVAFTDADVRNISRNAVKTNKRGSNVTMYETGQGAKKKGTKLVIDQVLVELRKFAAIAIATDELDEDAAIDFWSEVAQGFAEERARIADELVFVDDGGSLYNQTGTGKGILEVSGTATQIVGTTIEDFDWDDLLDAEVKVPSVAARNGKHYLHRTTWNVVRKGKGEDGHYILPLTAGLQTPWGTPVKTVDVLPAASEVGSNEKFGCFGDLKRVKLYQKRGLVLKQLTEATVTDADEEPVNLAEQDMTGLRAVSRMVALVKFPEAFTVYTTGTVS